MRLTLNIHYDRATVRQTAPDTWILDNIPSELITDALEDKKPTQYTTSNSGEQSFTIRQVPGPEPSYRICYWLDRR